MSYADYAWPGGYPIIHIDHDGEVLCPECAKAEHAEQGTTFTQDVHWEGPPEHCANCNRAIESAYGEVEEVA